MVLKQYMATANGTYVRVFKDGIFEEDYYENDDNCERCYQGEQEIELADGEYICSDCYSRMVDIAHDRAKYNE